MVKEKTGVKGKEAKGIKKLSDYGDIKHIKEKKPRLSQKPERIPRGVH